MVSERIEKRRMQLNYTKERLAQEIGVSTSTITRYESGDIKNMGIDKLIPIAKALKTTPLYLMGWEDEPSTAIERVPDSLKDLGVDYVEVLKEMEEGRITKEELKIIINTIKQMRNQY
jgi:transcriptional regulator with XRE-family HTH domain